MTKRRFLGRTLAGAARRDFKGLLGACGKPD